MRKVLFAGIAVLALFSCSKQDDVIAPAKSNLKTTLSPSAFNYWTTCGSNAYTDGTTIYVPITASCGSQVNAAQQKSGQTASYWAADINFIGGKAAYAYSEESVFTCDNVSQWNGDEMGFVYTLQDGYFKAYIQGGGQYYTAAISSSGWHNYKCAAYSANTVTYYVDNVQKAQLTNYSGTYTSRYYYFVATNHWAGGSSNNFQIQVKNINVW